MSRRKRLAKAWRRAVAAEVEAAITPERLREAKRYLAQPRVIQKLVELVRESLIQQGGKETPLARLLREGSQQVTDSLRGSLSNDDFLEELAPTWLKICHCAAWNRVFRETEVGQQPPEDMVKAARSLVLAIVDDPDHRAACLEKLAAIVDRRRSHLDTTPYGIPKPFLEAFQEEEQGS